MKLGPKKLAHVLAETGVSLWIGTLVSLLGILILYLTLPENWADFKRCTSGVLCNDYHSPYNCWSKSLTNLYIIQNLKQWWAFSVISILLWRKHPINRDVPLLGMSINILAIFIFCSGITHLIEAYTAINPVYCLLVVLETINGYIAVVAAIFSCWSINYCLYAHKSNQEQLRLAKEELRNCAMVNRIS